ncbi:hypothetical protein IL306_002696 [Fusarium sp. DS 682]|nr:hypothetical protein IL306_002696 [Fusarium sp. DS 682]
MADCLGIASSIASLAVFAYKSSNALYTTIRDFQSQDKNARALKNELADLRGVLQSLAETVDNNDDVNFDALKLPLLRCGKTCEEYGDLIARRATASIPPNVLEEYKDLIRDTTNDLQEHIQLLEERVHGKPPAVEDPVWLAILEEKQSTQEGLKICSQLSAQIEKLESASKENPQCLSDFAELTMFSPETAQRALLDQGFVDLEDATVGNVVLEMERRDFPYLTPFGLKYCKQHILDDEVSSSLGPSSRYFTDIYNLQRIRIVIESSLGDCSLGHWLRYGAKPGHIECFRRGGKQAGLRVLVVQQFCKDSEVEIWQGSHLHDLPTTDGIRSLHETTRSELEKAGCIAKLKQFQSGGLSANPPFCKLWVIRDARTYAETLKGYAITFLFAVADSLSGWPKILLANSPKLIRMAVEMETPKIRLNFAIKDTNT